MKAAYNLMTKAIFILLLGLTTLISQAQAPVFEEASTFFPDLDFLNQGEVRWGYLSVPENWDKPNGNTIKLAIAIIKGKAGAGENSPTLFLDGGPGAGGVLTTRHWMPHPLRETGDIILIDTRGTGFSTPRLCPELGDKFLESIAENQSGPASEVRKNALALDCQRDLLNRGIDLAAYNSNSVAKDLHAAKVALGYKKWNVYGVSYGTQFAQVYAQNFPEDHKSLILDSAISAIAECYHYNTSNYMTGLEKVFNYCKEDPECKQKYPDLENTFYATLKKLKEQPITVEVDKSIIPSGQFTFNDEDLKIATQQALYQRKLVEVLPLLITEFNNENKGSLSSLVAAFKGALDLDYGVYYAVICNEAIPYNSLNTFDTDAAKHKRLGSGISFYRSDFSICEKWMTNVQLPPKETMTDSLALALPTLIFAGEFDPITPPSNGKMLKADRDNAYLVEVAGAGHAPGFALDGRAIIKEFVQQPNQQPSTTFKPDKISFANNITINNGISNMANSINEFDPLFFFPILAALIVFLLSLSFKIYSLIKGRATTKLYDALIILTSLAGILILPAHMAAIMETASQNFYLLAFGLPAKFDYLQIFSFVFLGLSLLTALLFVFNAPKISGKGVQITTLFSFGVMAIYLSYWGFF